MKKYLTHEITVILFIKLLAIAAIHHFFFGPDTKHKLDAERVSEAMLDGANPASSPTR